MANIYIKEKNLKRNRQIQYKMSTRSTQANQTWKKKE